MVYAIKVKVKNDGAYKIYVWRNKISIAMADVVLNNIVKTYNKGEIKAVNNVSFEVNKGELFGLIGADGAGKTSIFRILTTLLLAR
jgi:ABC-type glutathione transport system ATPase component